MMVFSCCYGTKFPGCGYATINNWCDLDVFQQRTRNVLKVRDDQSVVGNRRQLEIFASNCGEFARGIQKEYSWKPSVLVKAQKRWIKFICKSRSMQILVYSYTKIIARRFRTSWKQIRLRLVSISRKWHWCFYVLLSEVSSQFEVLTSTPLVFR